jgi:2-oxoglutarate ferredoxin oxidoreductase subunit alpha
LKKKFIAAKEYVPKPVTETMDGAEIGIIAFGSTEPAIQEARSQLAQSGIPTDFLRIRAIPFTEEVGEFMTQHRVNYVFEMNRDGQLNQLLILEHPERCRNLVSIAYTDGLPPTARQVREAILTEEAKQA